MPSSWRALTSSGSSLRACSRMLQRIARPVELQQRVGRGAQRLELQHAARRLLGEHQDVAGALLAAARRSMRLCHASSACQYSLMSPTFSVFQSGSLRLGNLLVDRAARGARATRPAWR